MIRFMISRIIQTLILLYLLITGVFFLFRLTGDPTFLLVGSQATEKQIAEVRASLGLDKPYLTQYRIYLKNLLKGDFGRSINQGRPVIDMFAERLPNTLKLAIPSVTLGLIIAFILGVTTAIKRDSLYDNVTKIIIVAGIAAPPFFIALILILGFSVWLNWLPPAAIGKPHISHYIMPVLVGASGLLPFMQKIIRSSMLEVMNSEYIKLARIKGLSERKVIWKHTMRNAMITPLTGIGYLMSGILAGSIIAENFFVWPGIAQLSFAAFTGRDFVIVQAYILIMGALLLLSMFLVDISYFIVDPQIRYKTV